MTTELRPEGTCWFTGCGLPQEPGWPECPSHRIERDAYGAANPISDEQFYNWLDNLVVYDDVKDVPR